MALYLAVKEIWRNKSRFFLFSLVIALITVLVLFIAALAQGLASANKEYLEKLNAELLVFQENVEFSTTSSRVGRDKFNDIQRVKGIAEIGRIGFSSATITFDDNRQSIDVALIGVEPGKPGMPPVFSGEILRSARAYQAIIDGSIAKQAGVKTGDTIIIKTNQGADEEFTEIRVIGITDGRQYFFQPSIFVPFDAWDKIRPQAGAISTSGTANVVAIKLTNPEDMQSMAIKIQEEVGGVEVVDRKTAYESAPGYQAQQSTLNTQQGFTLLIGILVIGGFFQIQTLQKVPQMGMLKAIGTSNHSVAIAVILQIIVVTVFGVLLGSLGSFTLAALLPAGIPFVFTGNTAAIAIVALMLIGPIGGLVSVRLALKVEPLAALGM